MGLFSRIKKFFSKDIELDFDISSVLLFPYKLKKGHVYLGNKITVPENFVFVLSKSGKILDTIPFGKHELKAVILPKSVKYFRLGKIRKDGSLPTRFSPNAYFLNLTPFEHLKWKTYRKVECFDPRVGYFKVSADGKFAFKINEPESFLKELFKVYDYLKINEAEKLLCSFVSEMVISIIEKSDYDFDDLVEKVSLTDKVFNILVKKLEKIGVVLLGFSFENVNLPKNITEKLNSLSKIEEKTEIEILKEKSKQTNKNKISGAKSESSSWVGFEMIGKKNQNANYNLHSTNQNTKYKSQNINEVETNDLRQNKKIEDDEIYLKEMWEREKKKMAKKNEALESVPRSSAVSSSVETNPRKLNMQFDTQELQLKARNDDKLSSVSALPPYNDEKQVTNTNNDEKYVDLSLDNLYYNVNTNNVLRCKFCGAENSTENEECEICGENLSGKLRN